MSLHHTNPTRRAPEPVSPGVIEFAALNASAEFAFDLLVLEAGLRLKVLPLREAQKRGASRALDADERRQRRTCLAGLCRHSPLTMIDEGLFADAVARRPGLAMRMAKTLRRAGGGLETTTTRSRAGF